MKTILYNGMYIQFLPQGEMCIVIVDENDIAVGRAFIKYFNYTPY